MRFLRNFLLLIILVYGLAYGYLWYETNNALQRITEGAAPFAKIDYASFFVSPLANEITVDNISIVPQMAPDEFRIGQVRLFADQIGFFLITGQAMQNGKLPEAMDINLSSIQFRMDNKLFAMLEQMADQAPQSNQSNVPFADIDALGCGDIGKFSLTDYRMMGMKQINADLSLHLSYDDIGNTVGVRVDANSHGIYDFSIASDIKVPDDEMSRVTQAKSIPPMRISLNDSGFYKMRNDYCASANNSSVEEYVDNHIQLLANTLGINLPEPVTTAYRDHMLKGGRISIAVKPQSDISPEELAYYKPVEVADILGLKLTIGRTRVDIEQLLDRNAPALAKNEKKPAEKANTATTQSVKKAAAKPVSEPPAQLIKKTEQKTKSTGQNYRVVKVENAERHIDKMVEVTLPGNKVRRGRLEQVRNGRLYLIMQLHGGSLTYPVKTTDIRKFRVMY